MAEHPEGRALVLASEGWHPGVIGIVASRIAERHHRPAILIALEGEEGSGSGRSIKAFDLLGGLHASAGHLLRYGGHKAAAGLTIAASEVDAFREAFLEHADSVLTDDDLVPEVRIDAVAQGDALSLDLAEELQQLAPFGMGNPAVSLLVPAATMTDAEARSARAATSRSRSARAAPARAASPSAPAIRSRSARTSPPTPPCAWRSTAGTAPSRPKLVLRQARPCAPRAIDVLGEPEFAAGRAPRAGPRPGGVVAGVARRARPARRVARGLRLTRDLRGTGIAGILGDLVASGEPVLAVTAHAPHRARALAARVGGFAVVSWAALEDDPGLAAPFPHVVAVDPPTRHLLDHPEGEGWTHLAWGAPELDFAVRIHEWDFNLRDPLTALYRALRAVEGRAR